MLSGIRAVQNIVVDLLKVCSLLLWSRTMQSCCPVLLQDDITAFNVFSAGMCCAAVGKVFATLML